MTPILHDMLPYDPFKPRPLPGIAPADPEGWLVFDEAYAPQMIHRRALLAHQREDVLYLDPSATDAARELLDLVLKLGFDAGPSVEQVEGPDGVLQMIDRADPMGTLGRIAQQDFCILQPPNGLFRGEGEHILTAAALCFPASWRLAEKAGRPLTHIHAPVAEYTADIARRVQRLFDGIQVGRPLWRFNALWYEDPELFQPRSSTQPRPITAPEASGFLRSEQQTLLRLPKTNAVVFVIHTRVLSRARALSLWQPLVAR